MIFRGHRDSVEKVSHERLSMSTQACDRTFLYNLSIVISYLMKSAASLRTGKYTTKSFEAKVQKPTTISSRLDG